MATTNGQRVARYKCRMQEAGFFRMNAWIHPDLEEFIDEQRDVEECTGRCLERLLLGAARPRPPKRYLKREKK